MGILIYFTFATFILGYSSAQQSCTAIDLVANFIVGNETVLQWNATLRAENGGKNGATKVSIENVASTSSPKYHLTEESKAKASINGNAMIPCSSSRAGRKNGCSWSTTNSTFNLALPVVLDGNSGDAQIFEGVIDENSISLEWGVILQPGNKCNQDGEGNSHFPNVQVQIQQCCTTFITVPPPPSSAPTCKKYKSRAIIRNSDFSIFSTVNTTIYQNMMSLEVTSDYTGPTGSALDISANGYYTMCMTHLDTTSTCSFPLVMGDSKYIFLLKMHDKSNAWNYALSAGRFVIRNKEILMEEGVAFTKNNDCFYTSVKYDDGKMGTTELCCKEFA
uniref:Uncharacterized protein n=1 Tax=Panagrolaimus davidi TaxID=227884 RepID=A0A914QL49_9BILA